MKKIYILPAVEKTVVVDEVKCSKGGELQIENRLKAREQITGDTDGKKS